MITMTLKGIPKETHRELKKRAADTSSEFEQRSNCRFGIQRPQRAGGHAGFARARASGAGDDEIYGDGC